MTRRFLISFPFLVAPLLGEADAWLARLGGQVETDSSGRVTSVNLRGSWINDVEMLEIARLEGLKRLNLSHTRITDEGLLCIKNLKSIEDLNLEYAELITDGGMTSIRGWPNLTRLNIRGTRVGDGTMEILGGLVQLVALDVGDTDVTDTGFDYLITLTSLEDLGLTGDRVGPIGISSLRLLTTLKRLDLSSSQTSRRRPNPPPLNDELSKAIAGLTSLETLELGRLGVTVESLQTFSHLDSVQKLGLAGCKLLGDAAIDVLAGWRSLQRLDLQETSVTATAVAKLRDARPALRVLANPDKPDSVGEPEVAAERP
jgi:Leucine-rich repeat (LRR) protein